METGRELQNREVGGEPKGSEAAQELLRRVKGRGAPKSGDAAADLAALRERIERARAVAPPLGDDQFAKGCFIRGRESVLSIIDGEDA